ncbi:LAMI_0H06458g1_1 [Lachancea mirantina]|uniref:dynamin GTPase n=1 Tax=Lachancea mirantina TaxID=1230905 RepID=A0A1G4KF91_9SACH|nr:LAMI_0H06458g1_1 [Lachancea mirantina]
MLRCEPKSCRSLSFFYYALNRRSPLPKRCYHYGSAQFFRNTSYYHSLVRPSPFVFVSNYMIHPVASKRFASFFPKFVGRVVRLPAYVGGGAAALTSYMAYKVEEAGNFTRDKLTQLKDFSDHLRARLFGVSGGDGEKDPNKKGDRGGEDAAVAAALLASTGAERDKEDQQGREDEEEDEEEDRTEDEMLNLTKQMIEIRSLLNRVDSSSANLTLPSIVVIGSQSSGKSSVLEAIVGRDFLPKGSNMVTRRPIELTLVNTPGSNEATADFPSLRLYNLKDFQEVKRVLTDQNMAVPSTEAVSAEPIQLTIKSSRVPDLSMVDLPGYIQVEAADQPMELKNKIRLLCERYLAEPNIILAISAADVDLANSSALRASRAADPKGLRTIGVITKLDLVEPAKARSMLNSKKYPLKMGYVGVITKAPGRQSRLFEKNSNGHGFFSKSSGDKEEDASRGFERKFFADNRQFFTNCQVSTKKLRQKLIKILETSMSSALEPTSRLIQQELDDTSYLFKVEFNDRQLTPKSYLLNNVDVLKLAIKEFQERFNRYELKSILKADIDQRVLDLLASRYWKDDHLLELSSRKAEKDDSTALYWHKKLELCSSSLTKVGVGRLSTTLVTNAILRELENILDSTQLKNHDLIKELVNNTAINVLNSKYYATADQVENCIKPFKYEIDLEDRDWTVAHEHSVRLIKEELRQCNDRIQTIKHATGGRKLQQVMTYLQKDPSREETLGFSAMLLERGREALFLEKRSYLLNFRLKTLKGKCQTTADKDMCPEVFLNAVGDKLTSTAVLFLNVELLSDFFYSFPIELDKKLSALTDDQVELFAKEDPRIARHIELQKRKELLELALDKIDSILVFRKSYKGVHNPSGQN